jgi:putative ABC transport system permease protein
LDGAQPVQAVYDAMLQNAETTQMTLTVRTSLAPASMTSAITNAVHQVDPDVPVAGMLTMDALVDQSLTQQRLSMVLLAAFAALALLLAAVGIYGVQAYAVRHRVREIGIRLALGAELGDVFRLIVGHGLKLTCIGISIGLGAALGLTRLMASLLYGVSATDSITFAGVSMLLAIVAFIACYIPGRRAMRVDPMASLRSE